MSCNRKIMNAVLWASLLPFAAASSLSQDSTTKPKNNVAKAPAHARKTSLHIKVVAERRSSVPGGSRIELYGQNACRELEPKSSGIRLGEASFESLPRCKVLLRIFITGFSTKSLPVDLGKYKDPMQILVKVDGPPIVQNAQALNPGP